MSAYSFSIVAMLFVYMYDRAAYHTAKKCSVVSKSITTDISEIPQLPHACRKVHYYDITLLVYNLLYACYS
jgi:hypothetical protein